MSFDLAPIMARFQAIWEGLLRTLPNLAIAALIFGLFLLLSRGLSKAVGAIVVRAGQSATVVLVFTRLVSWTVRALGLMIAMTIVVPTLTAASLFGALGVTGIAIGFAFKDIFQNLLAGLLILLTRPFRLGDQIVSGPHEGTVEEIQVRATLLRTYDNRRVVIPNSELYTNRVVVITAFDRIRLAVQVGIGYGDDILDSKRIILAALDDLDDVLKAPAPQVLVRALGDFSVNLEVRFWLAPPIRKEVVEAEDVVLTALKAKLMAAGIDLPMPTQQVLFHDQTEETDGDRSRQREGWPARGENPRSRQAVRASPVDGEDRDAVVSGRSEPVAGV